MSTMRMLRVKQLAYKDFSPYGTFAPVAPPTSKPLAAGEVIKFWPDAGGVVSLGPAAAGQVAVGICQVKWRPLLIDICEFHTATSEGILPLDGDIYLHVGPVTSGDQVPVDDLEVFFVPKGTFVVLKPGVWHHAPFAAVQGQIVNTQILLPPRTYANDCIVKKVDPPVPFSCD